MIKTINSKSITFYYKKNKMEKKIEDMTNEERVLY